MPAGSGSSLLPGAPPAGSGTSRAARRRRRVHARRYPALPLVSTATLAAEDAERSRLAQNADSAAREEVARADRDSARAAVAEANQARLDSSRQAVAEARLDQARAERALRAEAAVAIRLSRDQHQARARELISQSRVQHQERERVLLQRLEASELASSELRSLVRKRSARSPSPAPPSPGSSTRPRASSPLVADGGTSSRPRPGPGDPCAAAYAPAVPRSVAEPPAGVTLASQAEQIAVLKFRLEEVNASARDRSRSHAASFVNNPLHELGAFPAGRDPVSPAPARLRLAVVPPEPSLAARPPVRLVWSAGAACPGGRPRPPGPLAPAPPWAAE